MLKRSNAKRNSHGEFRLKYRLKSFKYKYGKHFMESSNIYFCLAWIKTIQYLYICF